IQYSLGDSKGLHSKVFCLFLEVNCHETIKTCREIKVCEIANINIVTTPHYNINPDTDLILHDDNNLNKENQIKINTIGENQDENTSNEKYIIQKTSLKNKIEIMKDLRRLYHARECVKGELYSYMFISMYSNNYNNG
ncbi:16633_t:CDS:2, partial [Racocetra persica]